MAPQPARQSRSTAASRDCDMVSKSSSGPIFGFQKASQTPYNSSEVVPDTTKSFAKTGAPIKSIAAMKGPSFASSPATTGSTKYGPNLFSYRVLDTRLENTLGRIGLFSLREYILSLKSNFCFSVWTSVRSPDSPMKSLSPIWNTFFISQAIVCCWIPYRISEAIATQSLPTIATMALPLYWRILIWKEAALEVRRQCRMR
mmetsp:Transcript_6029/g.10018  ORF Transcript_6029/g.10018 Transcript_6029/m.10018 type:complete len:201 (-) Transcript_6029:3-605(-)